MKIIKNLCIIPARSGSKRIPNKNIKDFAGKPIIAYAIEKALESQLFDEVIVSTNSEKIASISSVYGARIPFLRSEETSNDYATISDVVKEVLINYSNKKITVENFGVVFSTVPLLNIEKIKRGFELLNVENLDSVFSIKKYRHPIERALYLDKDLSLHFCQTENSIIRTQDFEPKYYDAGQFYFSTVQSFNQSNKLIGEKNKGIILDFLESVDIDNEEDWELAETLFCKTNSTKHETGFKQ